LKSSAESIQSYGKPAFASSDTLPFDKRWEHVTRVQPVNPPTECGQGASRLPRAVQVVDLYLGKIAVLKLDEQVIEDRPMQSIDVEPGDRAAAVASTCAMGHSRRDLARDRMQSALNAKAFGTGMVRAA